MKKTTTDKLLVSPTDLLAFLGCNHSTFLDLQFTLGKENKPTKSATSAAEQLLSKLGYEHEKKYLYKLKTEFTRVVEIPRNSQQNRVEQTYKAMQSGADIIYQAVLQDGNWMGEADFLLKVFTTSNFGDYSYQALDTKLSRVAEPKHIIQLCFYSELLSKLQGTIPTKMHLVLGDNRQETFAVTDYLYYYQNAKKRFQEYIEKKPQNSYPEPCNACPLCSWKDHCTEVWAKDDHLSIVANIQKTQIQKLKNVGIDTLEKLANIPEIIKVEELNTEVFQRLKNQASLQYHKRITGENKYDILPDNPGKGFNRIPLDNQGDLFFDMEGDPLHPNGLEYLFGIYYLDGHDGIFRTFWAHDHQAEKATFREFMEFVEQRLKLFPEAYIYHYNHYETTALKRLACRYAVAQEQLDNLLRKGKFIDLYKVVREAIRVSEPSYSIKNLEKFYMEKRTGEVTNAVDSIVQYNQWRYTGDQKILDEIAQYNKNDCISTYELRNWLVSISPINSQNAAFLEAVEKNEATERKEWEIEFEDMQRALLSCESEDLELPERLINLLEFHRREDKPQWWAYFERKDKTVDELVDDIECIGDMTLLKIEQHEQKKHKYTYQFPAQESKLTAAQEVKSIGEVEVSLTIDDDIDERNRIVKFIYQANKDPLPNRLSIGPKLPINNKVIRTKIYEAAHSFLNRDQKYKAIFAILERKYPSIVGHIEGENIIKSEDLLAETKRVISNLDESYMFIQGPPGAGKTFISAHVICHLLKSGKRIGVSANSHKAIENLLKKIEEVAINTGVTFTGVKKSSKDKKGYQGKLIRNTTDNKQITREDQLVAGTVWLFASKEYDQQFDYLFIDEAGQVCLANVLAMGTAAKNIVLVGDQMQLGQPTQGVHPGDAGESVLEFLLKGDATIPPQRGIFLKNTYRLHPSICDFISDAIYEGKLKAHENAAKRQLIFSESIADISSPKGIQFIWTRHRGCSQKSEQEGAIIKDLFSKLLNSTFQDEDGTTRQIRIDDILVVSPYNMQVNYLVSILPSNARVGTVDKLQGQEAPIVLCSLTTSGAEEMPRNIEFLYSKNRLNVALSRAQCLIVVVGNLPLLEIPCGTVEQMKLVNTFCWLKNYVPPLLP